jgi:hypothetical protein
MNHRRVFPLRSAVLAAILILGSVAELAAAPQAAEAQTPLVNAGLGFVNVIAAGARRRGTYIAADQNQRDFNRYYDSLRDTARTQLVSGELSSLHNTQSGLQHVRTGAYVKVYEATRAEQDAVTRAIEAEKNEARLNFNRTVVRELTDVIIRLPGAQQILSDVRETIANLRAAVIALQSAIAAGRPFDLLREQLANQVRDSALVQNAVRNLGTMVGQDLDRSMGGALTRVDHALERAQEEMATAATGLDQIDAQVAALSTERASVGSGDRTGSGFNIRITDSTQAVLDAASSALAFITAIQGGHGTTREEMYQQIRNQMLLEHNAALVQSAQSVSLVTCTGVGRGEYDVAMGTLGKPPGTVPDPEHAAYIVCTDRESGQPVHAYIVGGGVEAAATPGEGTPIGEPVLHAGTYVGEAAFPELEVDDKDVSSEKVVSVNVVRLTVLEDAQVEGELTYEAQETVTGRDCGSRWAYSVYGTFGGSLAADTGSVPLASTMSMSWTPFRLGEYPCGDPGSASGTYTWDVRVQVRGDHMSGEGTTADDSGETATFTFEADRE